MRAHLTTLWILGSVLFLAPPLCRGAEIAPTTGAVDEEGNEILEGEEVPGGKAVTPSKRKRPPSAFAEKNKSVSLPAAGEDLPDDGGADDVPLPTHPLLRRAVQNRQRAGQSEASEASEASASSSDAQEPPAEPSAPSGWLILLGIATLLGAGAGWLYRLYSLGRPQFETRRKATR